MNNKEKQLSDALHKHFQAEFGREYLRAQKAAINLSWEIHMGSDCNIRAEKRYFARLNRLKNFIDEHLSDFYIDLDCDYISTSEPEPWIDEDGEFQEPYLENTYHVTRKEASKLLFGIAAEYI